jgi:hypothetical protein
MRGPLASLIATKIIADFLTQDPRLANQTHLEGIGAILRTLS